MTYKYRIDEAAAALVLEAALWYEEKREGLGSDLILCFEEGIEAIQRNPFFEERYKNLRLYNIHRFPYQIIYYVENDLITIVAFFHARRDPKNWKKG
jgi:plasmid stabilization system protein ParE